jgi:uncharacterized protein YbaR (Trm112 family)
MKKELMDVLACPVCKGELALTVGEEKEKEIIRGLLYCKNGEVSYPIEDAISNLLPPDNHK